MKTKKLLLLGMFLIASFSSQAQISVNVNLGRPPAWGPVGYSEVEYYYIPDVESYYDIRNSQFIYFNRGKWIRSRYLPGQYRNYDLYNGYKVVLNDYHGNSPHSNFNAHKVKYQRGYNNGHQNTIGEKHEKKEFKNKGRKGGKH